MALLLCAIIIAPALDWIQNLNDNAKSKREQLNRSMKISIGMTFMYLLLKPDFADLDSDSNTNGLRSRGGPVPSPCSVLDR